MSYKKELICTEKLMNNLTDMRSPEEALLSVKLLEERYRTESLLMQAVSTGQLHKAESLFSILITKQPKMQNTNRIRDLKNHGFVLNTTLKIAASEGGVHPIHLEKIFSQYMCLIEDISSPSDLRSRSKEMIRKYCLLVKNHSLKNFSLLVRKVITRIDADLTADLGLKAQAGALNVNPSYLSTLFKKETGTTLTEYVNRKRIDHAMLLLNSSDMQIQTIAQCCGMPDVNYFSKTFKKRVGKSPKEYRNERNHRKYL